CGSPSQDFSRSVTKKLIDITPVRGGQCHCLVHFRRIEAIVLKKDRFCAQIFGKLDVRDPVTDHIRALEIIIAFNEMGEHPCIWLAGGFIFMSQTSINKHLRKSNTFALKCSDQKILDGIKIRLWKRIGS